MSKPYPKSAKCKSSGMEPTIWSSWQRDAKQKKGQFEMANYKLSFNFYHFKSFSIARVCIRFQGFLARRNEDGNKDCYHISTPSSSL